MRQFGISASDLEKMMEADQHHPLFENKFRISLIEHLESLTAAVDDLKDAAYDTAKVQPANEVEFPQDFLFALNTAIEGFEKLGYSELKKSLEAGRLAVLKARKQ